MPTLKDWLQAARLRTLPLALSCVLTGSAAALQVGSFSLEVFFLALSTALCLQVLSNFANDYGDYGKGTDNMDRLGPQRSLQSGRISPVQMKNAMIVWSILSLVSGIALLHFSGLQWDWKLMLWLLAGLTAIYAAIRYTAGEGAYGYRMMGDPAVFLFFGLMGVTGTYYMHSGSVFPSNVLLLGVTLGSFSTVVLHLNNMRDIQNDEEMGKRTIAVNLGISRSKTYHAFLLIVGWLSLFFYLLSIDAFNSSRYWWIPVLPLVVHIRHWAFTRRAEGRALDPELKKIALSTFLISLMLFVLFWIEWVNQGCE